MAQPAIPLTTPSARDIAFAIERGWADHVMRDQSVPTKRDYVYASGYSDCLRRMVYEMTRGDEQSPFDAETYARFRRGNDRERDLLSDLMRIGRDCDPRFEVISQQERFELRDRKGRTAIVGKVDARLRFPWRASYPLEIKSWSTFITEGVEDFDDLFRNRWTKRGAYQLLMYLLGAGEPMGFILLDRPGLPQLLPVELDDRNLERAERFLSRAEEALDHKDAGTLPGFVDDTQECQYCPFFGSVCQAPIRFEPVEVVFDPEAERMLERRQELEPAAKEYDRIDRTVKERFRPDPGKEVKTLVGKFLLRGSWGKSTRYDIPEEVKAPYKVVDPAARFTLKIESMGGQS